MDPLVLIGCSLIGLGIGGVLSTGALIFLASQGVQPVPDRTPAGAPRSAEQDALRAQRNERYLKGARVVLYISVLVAVAGAGMVAVGVTG